MSRKIALVTGGSRGLGREAALRLAEAGHDLILTYKSQAAAAEAVCAEASQFGAQAKALALDVGQVASFEAFFDQVRQVLPHFGGRTSFDFLINNAGIGSHSMIAQTSEAEFDELCNIHFKGVYFLTQKALPLLADGGRIVNLSSGLARFSFPGYAAYASMKGAVEVFTRYCAKELGARGITANIVAPGAIATDFNKDRFEGHPEIPNMIASLTALGRVGVAEDVGGVVAFLCSEAGRWVNGQRLEVAGGIFL